ncbi:GntR family transcriptional regulator [Nonomuraea sediminis]|uniref:GntR family transcriptional regulator n=1 Tax=Nonomuraea sediminis TaxID=2835864 RepID=UPI001BDD6513|nr:winged helix-turn-helix domain-containing protein [Nonomuraea sediminis]
MLDAEGKTHVYLQLSEIIRARVADLPPGSPVPSETDISQEFGVSRTTARRAMHVLRVEGLVHTVQGAGTFAGLPDHPRPQEYAPVYERIAGEIVERIKAGRLQPNRPIPSEKTLMQQYGVAKPTVRRAAAFLRDKGWVFTVPYRGTYVVKQEDWPEDAQHPYGQA